MSGQQVNQSVVTIHTRDVHGCGAHFILRETVSAVCEQQPHNVLVAFNASHVQGCVIETDFHMDVGASLNEQTDNFDLAVYAGTVESCEALEAEAVFCTVIQQQPHRVHVPVAACCVQRGLVQPVSCVDLRAKAQEKGSKLMPSGATR